MELIKFAIIHDWAVLLPIIACSILLLAVTIERYVTYRRDWRDVAEFVPELRHELQRGTVAARKASDATGGLLGQVSAEGLGALEDNPANFERSFDITVSLAVRSLERRLSIIGTIATVSPYLGLFGTVVRILLTFGEMSQAAGAVAAPKIMFGIGSALIATAFGLAVAILSVGVNNYFHAIVSSFEEDFQILKLVLIEAADAGWSAARGASPDPARTRRAVPPAPQI